MWELAFYIGLPVLAWQYKLYRDTWGRRAPGKSMLFSRLNPWKIPLVWKIVSFPFSSSPKSGPRVSDTADREQALSNYEADRVLEKYKRSRFPGRRK